MLSGIQNEQCAGYTLETLQQAAAIGKAAGLHYVYQGNVPDAGGKDTVCYLCGAMLADRSGARLHVNDIVNDVCPEYGAPVAGIGMSA